jgi:hypothetical protein
MATQNALELLGSFCVEGIAIDVTHFSKPRLFGLAGLAPLRDQVLPLRRPEPGSGQGRPPIIRSDVEPLPASLPPPEHPMTPVERRLINCSDLEGAMAHLELTIRDTRWALDALPRRDVEKALSDAGT